MRPLRPLLAARSIALVSPENLRAQHDDDVHPFLTDTCWLKLGAYFPSSDFEVAVHGTLTGGHQEVDVEETLGIGEDDEVFSAACRWN